MLLPLTRSLAVVSFALMQVLLAAAALAAFNGRIEGTVRDDKTKAPIAGVAVTAKSSSAVYRTVTNAKGAFTILGVVPDTYVLSFDAKGYLHGAYPGVTVLADSAQRVEMTLSRSLSTIARVTSHSMSSAYQPQQTEDSYSFNSTSIEQVMGHAFNEDQTELLRSIPSVTVDRTGTVDIRGGLSFQTAYQYEGIDYTEPQRNLQNSFANVSNFGLLNGIGSVQLIPGGGDATHGDTGTGLISYHAKRGTYPGFGSLDFQLNQFPQYNQIGGEYGIGTPDGRFSNYAAFTGIRQWFQYGDRGTPGALIGIYTGNGQIGVEENNAFQRSDDFVDNFFYKFGKNQSQQLQAFFQYQRVVLGLGYNGIGDLCYASCSGLFITPSFEPDGSTQYYPKLAPLFPGQSTFNEFVSTRDTIVSPFQALKIEYSNSFNPSTFLTWRVYRTTNAQDENEPATGIYIPQSGGVRDGTSGEFTKQLNEDNLLEVGGKFEFTHPYGTFEDFADYNYAFFDYPFPGINATTGIPNAIPANFMALDFTPASECTNGTFPVTNSYPKLAGGYGEFPCGYLSKYFPNGVPTLPPEVDEPVADQQVYGWFVQETMTHGKLKAQLGLRLDGYNFLFNGDPSDPPTIAAARHQRLYEPHVGVTYNLTNHDTLRATFGRTLAIPLPGLFGNDVSRASLSAFNGVPSYDNSTGLPAMYCGIRQDTQCTSYADQLYWVLRDAKFGANQLSSPLVGATFTNWDFTYSHDFGHGVAMSVTPFFRRGYNIVEQSASIVGVSGTTGLPLLSPFLYTNLGIQKATGIEMLATKDMSDYWSAQFSATYVNQLGNDPPGTYLPTASLELGNLYRSDLFSPFQATLAVTYKQGAWRFNPVISYNKGYPYGVGAYTQVFINGIPYNVPNTNIAQVIGAGAVLPVAYYIDPQNPGTRTNPIIIGNNGLVGGASAGSLLSRATWNDDFTAEYKPPSDPRVTLGVTVYNVLDQTYGVPITNPRYIYPISTGVFGPGTGTKPILSAPGDQSPNLFASNAMPYDPYLVFPNLPPHTIRFYTLVAL
jgi:hypothetical protein